MSSVKEKTMKRKLFGSSEQDDRGDGNANTGEKKRRRKNLEVPKHCPLSERQQLALLMQMTSAEQSPEPASPPPPTVRKTPGSSRKDKIHKRNERGETLLHLCTIRGDLDAMQELIKQGAEVNVQDFAGWTPLHEACNHGHQDITRYLLEVGANVNSRGLENDTPLHDAVLNSHRDLVELLLKHGANPLLANKRGERPLDIAEDDVIRELMQREVMSSDDSDSDPYPLSVKSLEKVRTTSTSSSNRDTSKAETKKQKRKSTDNDSSKTKSSFSRSSLSSSSESEDSDDMPLIQKNYSKSLTPQSNGIKQKLAGKTPTLTATPVRKSKSKLKTRHEKRGTERARKSKTALSSASDSSSDEFSSDSEAGTVKENGISFSKSDYKKDLSRLTPSEKKNHTKSLYTAEKPPRSSEKKAALQTNHKGKAGVPCVVKRNKSFSSEEEVPLSKVKIKTARTPDEKSKLTPTAATTLPRLNDRDAAVASVPGQDSGKSQNQADESIYDFLTTEDFTENSGIRLKATGKVKDKASELWDSLFSGRDNETDDIKKADLKVKPKSFSSDFDKDTSYSKSSVFSMKPRLDKNSNEILMSSKTLKPPDKLQQKEHKPIGITKTPSSSHSNTTLTSATKTPGTLHDVPKPPDRTEMSSDSKHADRKPVVVAAKPATPNEARSSSTVHNTDSAAVKAEQKPRKRSKDKQSTVTVTNQEKNDRTALSVSAKSAPVVKKDAVKTERPPQVNSDHQKTAPSGSKSKEHHGDKDGKHGLVKKKKKHKHQRLHDLTSAEAKERARQFSSETAAAQDASTIKVKQKSQDKTLHKTKSDSLKLQAVSRKSSQDSKSDTGSLSASPSSGRKKSKSCDVSENDAPKSSSKAGSSASKPPKTPQNSSAQEKHQGTTPSTAKKDKPEPKKLALVSDANSMFMSELEKSSRQKRELEKKLKLKRKKKLQQEKIRAQKSAEAVRELSASAGAEKRNSHPNLRLSIDSKSSDQELGTNRTGIEKDRTKFSPSLHGHHLAQPLYKEGTRVPVPPNPSYLSQHNLKEHDRTNTDPLHYPDHSIFKSALHHGRSMSQVDEAPSDRRLSDAWDPKDRVSYMSPENRHMPVHRSLSFAGQPEPTTIRSPARNLSANLAPEARVPHHDSLPNFPHHVKPVSAPTSLYGYSGATVPTRPHDSPGRAVPYNPNPHYTPLPGNGIFEHAVKHNLTGFSGSDVSGSNQAGFTGSPLFVTRTPSAPDSLTHTPTTALQSTSVTSATTVTSAASATGESTAASGAKPSAVTNDAKTEEEASVKASFDEKPPAEQELPEEVDSEEEEEERRKKGVAERLAAEKAEFEKKQDEMRKERQDHEDAIEKYVSERLAQLADVLDKPEPKRLPAFIPMEKLKALLEKDPVLERLNMYEEWAVIQKQIYERRKKYATAVIVPQAPEYYYEYITFKGKYLLSGSRQSWLSVPVLAPPTSVSEDMQALFEEHEKERVKLRLQHMTQREKLIVACEQEIMRVHGRAARTLQNQVIPLSACSVLLDREIYNLEQRTKKVEEPESGANRTAAIRDRFNTRMFLSWIQDVDDKYKKMKKALLRRQRHEAQALHAVQRTEWLLKLQEADQQGQQRWSNLKPEDITEVHVPIVSISEDFTLLPG